MTSQERESIILEISGLSKSFSGTPVLKDIFLSIKMGSITGIIGKSGSGKTTLFRCLNLLELPSKGEIKFQGESILEASSLKRRKIRQKMGMIFQSLNLLDNRTVFKNVALPLEFMNLSKEETKIKVSRALELVGLEDKSDAYPKSLSGGQKQRIAIARALVTEANLLLCDEFTSALDPVTTLDILALLRRINVELKVTLILITHDMEVVREICDEVYVLEKGEVIEKGKVEDIFYSPQHTITQALVKKIFEREVPQTLKARLIKMPQKNCDIMMRLIFAKESSQKPIISELMRELGISLNIISGHLDHIQASTFGNLLITFKYDPSLSDRIRIFFERHKVHPELLGYLKEEK